MEDAIIVQCVLIIVEFMIMIELRVAMKQFASIEQVERMYRRTEQCVSEVITMNAKTKNTLNRSKANKPNLIESLLQIPAVQKMTSNIIEKKMEKK